MVRARTPRRTIAPVAVCWLAAEPSPRGWSAWLSRLLSGYLAGLGYSGRGVALLVGNDAFLRRLNARYRGRARPTDILSFAYAAVPRRAVASARSVPAGVRGEGLIGELAVSLDRARAQAKENGWSLRTEMARLLAHGCAHLAGYDHHTRAQDREMRRVEEVLLDAAGFPGLYPAPAAPPSTRRKARARERR